MKRNFLIYSLLLITTFAILFVVFKPVLIHPNHYLFSENVDGMKSYFNFSYYLKYDSGIRHDGINYPYGDHLQYINSHPLYSQILKFIDKYIIDISTDGVGILNLTMIFSLLLAVPVLFAIMRRFDLPDWISFPASIVILFLSPQLGRIGGHYEMVYAFFIPLYWYLLIRWREGKKQCLWTTLLILVALVGGFTSAYYVAFFSIFTLAIFIIEIWNNRKNFSGFIRPGLTLLFIAILPLIIVKGFVNLTDWVNDRPENPWGFFVFNANLGSIFLPFYPFIAKPIGQIINTDFQWEGRAFVGLVPTIFSIGFIISLIVFLIKYKKPRWDIIAPAKKINTYLAASVLVLLFSMCFPFEYGFEFLVDIIPQLRQFRALGRFSWIFYYVISVYTVYFLYVLYLRLVNRNKKVIGIVMLLLSLGLWSMDAKTFYLDKTKRIFNENDKLLKSEPGYLAGIEKAGIYPEDYQAIFFLPFSNTCGDKLLSERGDKAFAQAMRYSYLTGLPLVQSFSPRLSFSQALSNYQLLANPAIYKTRVDDMNEKPLLLLMSKKKLSGQELRVKNMAGILYEDKNIYLARLPVEAFNRAHEKWKKATIKLMDSLPCENNICADVNQKEIYFDGFEDGNSNNAFTGKKALYKEEGAVELFKKVLYDSTAVGNMEISFWLYFDERTYGIPASKLYLIDNKGKTKQTIRIEDRKVFDIFGKWIRIADTLKPEENITYKLVVDGKYITVDDLLIKPVDSNVAILSEEGYDLFNNYPVD